MRIGTRGSALALVQAQVVAHLLGGAEVITIDTSDDRGAPPSDKSRWVLKLEHALSAREIDLAVHSAKDVPSELAEGLALLGAPGRAAAEDVLCGGSALDQLTPGARVGTSSLRRAAQLRAAREDLEVVPVRGNVDTRLRKLREDDFDALVLARAGLARLGREAEIGAVLDPARFVPSPGQGTLALEGRVDDERTREAVQAIADAKAFACLQAERAVAHALGASCNTPLGAHAVDNGCGCLLLRAWVGLPDGSAWLSDELLGGFYDPDALGRRVAERLQSAGADDLLSEAERHAPCDQSRETPTPARSGETPTSARSRETHTPDRSRETHTSDQSGETLASSEHPPFGQRPRFDQQPRFGPRGGARR